MRRSSRRGRSRSSGRGRERGGLRDRNGDVDDGGGGRRSCGVGFGGELARRRVRCRGLGRRCLGPVAFISSVLISKERAERETRGKEPRAEGKEREKAELNFRFFLSFSSLFFLSLSVPRPPRAPPPYPCHLCFLPICSTSCAGAGADAAAAAECEAEAEAPSRFPCACCGSVVIFGSWESLGADGAEAAPEAAAPAPAAEAPAEASASDSTRPKAVARRKRRRVIVVFWISELFELSSTTAEGKKESVKFFFCFDGRFHFLLLLS